MATPATLIPPEEPLDTPSDTTLPATNTELPHLIPPDETAAPTHALTSPTQANPNNPQPARPAVTHAPDSTQSSAYKLLVHTRAYDLPSVPALIAYLHATAGYPVKSTWLAAINRGAYASWPGITAKLVRRYCPEARETHLGHMAQPRQNIRSTKPKPTPSATHSLSSTPTITLIDIPLTQLYTDDTGRFHPRSRSGNQYLMVALHSTSNAILVHPFATKKDAHRIAAYQAIYARLKHAHQAPTLHTMDNEASSAFRQAITANECSLQLVPPHVHRRNAAERAIRTFKDHFLAILAGLPPSFPRDRWDLLIPQAELTLNLLRPASNERAPSAWHSLFGPFNFDATPMGPAGCKVLIHHKASIRRSWDFRALDGFYLGPALSHYRCYRVLNKHTNAVSITDAVRFCYHGLPHNVVSLEDKLLHALQAIQATIAGAPAAPSNTQIEAIHALRAILHHYMQSTTPPQPGVHRNTPPPTRPTTPPPAPGVAPVDRLQPAPLNAIPTPLSETAQPVASRTRSRSNAPLATAVLDPATGRYLEHRQLRAHPTHKPTWDASYANELGRLCQGIGTLPGQPTTKRIPGTDTFTPIHFHDIPSDRRSDITYTKVVCEVRPQKSDPYRTRITIGGNRIAYPGDAGTRTGSLETFKLLINSTLSTPGAAFACFDIANFYLGTPLDRPEFVKIQLSVIPDEFVDEYNLTTLAYDGWVYFKITKGVYGLKQSGKLANDLLATRLHDHGYYQCAITPGLWRHRWRPIMFVLIVDDFGIQYVDKRHAEHLLTALQLHYSVTTDWAGTKFAGIDLSWDYTKRTCRLSMNGYIDALLLKYAHPKPTKPQHAPHAHIPITYGAHEQMAPVTTNEPILPPQDIKRIQGIIGSLLYYARAVDNKLLATLSTISTQQAAATASTAAAVHQLLDYVATYPNDGITYQASTMVLAAHSDASFLTETGARSRAGAHIFLSDNDPIPRPNGPILSLSHVIKHVVASAAEAELAALYHTAREMVPLRHTLTEMGWPQPPSPLQTDNSTALGFVNDTIIQRRTKMVWHRLHWLRCRESQQHFRYYWHAGASNLADYHTKHHPPAYHLAHRHTHVG